MSAAPRRTGSVMKAGESARALDGMYALDLRDIGRQAEQMLASAQREAERTIAEARAEASRQSDLIRQTAHRTGYEEGLARGRQAGRAEALEAARVEFRLEQSELAQSLRRAVSAVVERREHLYSAARRDVMTLAVAIASRFLKRLSGDDAAASEAALEASREALELIAGATEVTIKAHPEDVAALERHAEELARDLSVPRHVRLVSDAGLARGSVIVETSESTVDGTVGHRLDRIADELLSDWARRAQALGLSE